MKHGDMLWQAAGNRHVIYQEQEAVLEVSLQVALSAAAGIGWAVGNLHLELMAELGRWLTPDEKATRQLFERLQVPYRETTAVFRPGRFARGDKPAESSTAANASRVDELGVSHKH